MTVDELRAAFLEFFEGRGHRRIPSSPLVPHGDPSLLFTSAGMVQFKPYFMGLEQPPATRMTSVQKCFRTTDVEEVGDPSHLTFFEMLGNFSIGDYFKPDAIAWAWEFLTGTLELDAERLWATVYLDDDEAFALWQQRGLPDRRILRYSSEQGNFWASGDTGPCGPCSELHYDFGVREDCPRCAEDTCHPDVGCGRFLEIWNLVFMAFDRQADGTLVPLPAQNIDTGAGLERVAWVLQDVKSVYETDQLRGILAKVQELAGGEVIYDPEVDIDAARAMRSITEHARAIAFLVADGVLPANEGRGYVLRRVLRRAVYFGYTIGMREAFLDQVVDAAIDASLSAHPELEPQRGFIRNVAAREEARFQQVLARGLELLEQVFEREAASKQIPGRDIFTLYDTHGLPPELTIEVAEQRGFGVDRAAFEDEMAAQRERSRGDESFRDFDDPGAERYAAMGLASEFVGYEDLATRSTVGAIVADGLSVDRLTAGETGSVVLPATAFYPEGGGQVGDRGELVTPEGRFVVEDTQRYGEAIAHLGSVVEGHIAVGDSVEAQVNLEWRIGSARNHTGTHLLHAALRAVLGEHVRQAGSYVGPNRLRFDYTHPESLSSEQLRTVQRLVNARVRDDIERETVELPYEEAIGRGAIAFFEDRYTANVRMVEYCDAHAHNADHHHGGECFSRELCGGTHLHSTGGVGMLQVVSDSSIGAGLRRIEALTGPAAERYVEERLDLVEALMQRFRVPADEVEHRVEALEGQLAEERRRGEQLARRASSNAAEELATTAEEVGGTHLLVARVEADSADALRALGDGLRDRLGSAVVVLGAVTGDRPAFLALVTDDIVSRGVKADELVRAAAAVAGGGGGGRPQLAQAGGRDVTKLDAALQAARTVALERLGAGS